MAVTLDVCLPLLSSDLKNASTRVTGYANRSPTPIDAIEDELQQALAICGGDAIAALMNYIDRRRISGS